MTMMKQRSISLTNDIQSVTLLSLFVDEVCSDVAVGDPLTMQVNMAMEEAVVNVINYAYPKGKQGVIHVVAEADDNCLTFTISDGGTPFDPTAMEDADVTLPAEERSIGGLGIHLVRNLMDSVSYERRDGKNLLTLKKKIPHHS